MGRVEGRGLLSMGCLSLWLASLAPLPRRLLFLPFLSKSSSSKLKYEEAW